MKSLEAVMGAMTLGALFGTACSHQAEHEAEMVPASSTVVASDYAVEKMANANCDREESCENIGPVRRYETRNLCLGTFEREKYAELGFANCLLGVDHTELDRCVKEIRIETCDSPLDKVETIAACRSRSLCRD